MPDFRGVRFTAGSSRFTAPKKVKAIVPQPLGSLGAGKEPATNTGPEAFCAGNQQFIGGTVSLPECYAFWALTVILGPEGTSAQGWTYQASTLGGRHTPGGAVVDFVVYDVLSESGRKVSIGIRVQGHYFHYAQGAVKFAADTEQQLDLEAYGMLIVDVYDWELIRDQTGKSALWVMNDAIQGIQHPNSFVEGMVLPD